MKLRLKNNRSNIFVFLLSSLLICMPKGMLASGTTSANFLKIGPGARPAGIGEAYTSIANDASSIYWNSAGLSSIQSNEISLSHNVWFQDIQHSFIALAYPISSPLSRYSSKCIGFSATYLNIGDMERRTSNSIESDGSFTASDFSFSVAYAQGLQGMIGFPLSSGLSLKYVRQSIAEYNADAVALDFGLMYPFMLKGLPLSAGFAVQNLGTSIKFINESYPLPLTYKAGLSYNPTLKNTKLPVIISFDVSMPNDADTNWKVGAEYPMGDILALRAGFMNQSSVTREALTGGPLGNSADSNLVRLTGLMAGFGVNVPLSAFSNGQALKLDYAFVPYGELGNTHRISLGLKW